MRMQTSGTVNRGQLLLDEPLQFPDQARVQVTIVLNDERRARYRSGLERFLTLIRERPIRSWVRFTRDAMRECG